MLGKEGLAGNFLKVVILDEDLAPWRKRLEAQSVRSRRSSQMYPGSFTLIPKGSWWGFLWPCFLASDSPLSHRSETAI